MKYLLVALSVLPDYIYSLLPLRYPKMRSMINLVEVVVPEAAKLEQLGQLYPRHRPHLRCNLQLHHKRSLHMELNSLYFIETPIRVAPVIAVLATVNEPETGCL
jgi:hypothetical protein